jgi:hypothetical protein
VVDCDEERPVVELKECALIRLTNCECSKIIRAAGKLVLVNMVVVIFDIQVSLYRLEAMGRFLASTKLVLKFREQILSNERLE